MFDKTALTKANAITHPRGVLITGKAKQSEKYQVERILLPEERKAYPLRRCGGMSDQPSP